MYILIYAYIYIYIYIYHTLRDARPTARSPEN